MLLLVLINALSALHTSALANMQTLVIGVVTDRTETQRLRPGLLDDQLVISELGVLLSETHQVIHSANHRVHAGWDRQQANEGLERLLADPVIDLILVTGAVSGEVALRKASFSKPVIIADLSDPFHAPAVVNAAHDSTTNLSYVLTADYLEQALLRFQEVVGGERFALLLQRDVVENLPGLAARLDRLAESLFLSLQLVPVGVDWQRSLTALEADVDGVLVDALAHLDVEQMSALAEALAQRGLASFSLTGVSDVERGFYAGMSPQSELLRRARRVALNIELVVAGETLRRDAQLFRIRDQLTINMATGRIIRQWPDWQVMAEAELLNLHPEQQGQRWDMASAIRRSLEANLDLRVADLQVAAGEAQVEQARAALLPQFGLRLARDQIDSDRAATSGGAIERRRSTAQLEFTQTLFSERVRALWDVAQLEQVARLEDRETQRQNIAAETAVAYLDLLSVRSSERIEQQNLRITRANLRRAQVRESVGYSGPGEVYRWQSELATARQRLLDIQAIRYQAEMALNRLLRQPLETRFDVEEADFSDKNLVVADMRFFRYVRDPQTFAVFRNYVVENGLLAAPELALLDARVSAQGRLKLASKRSFWWPELELRSGLVEQLGGSGGGVGPGGIPAPARGANETDWQVGLSAQLPLFTGGRRRAELAEVSFRERQLAEQRAALAQRIEQNIRSALQDSAASFAGISLAEDARLAAQRNLELVTSGYERGTVALIDLLDAQSAALSAGQRAASAVYAFLIDHVRVQRAAGLVDLFIDQTIHDEWFARLDDYFAEHQDEVVFP